MFKANQFISFEGIDGSGKTTQIGLLKDKLISFGKKVEVLREPGGTFISEKIRKILLDRDNLNLASEAESLLFFASRNQLVKEKIIPMLDKDFFIICDRFNDSTIAYQGYGFGKDIEKLEAISSFATLNKSPNLTFYLDISADKSISRRKDMKDDRIEKKGIRYLDRVRQGFLLLANRNSDRIITIDASLSKKEINNIIWNIVKEKYGIES